MPHKPPQMEEVLARKLISQYSKSCVEFGKPAESMRGSGELAGHRQYYGMVCWDHSDKCQPTITALQIVA